MFEFVHVNSLFFHSNKVEMFNFANDEEKPHVTITEKDSDKLKFILNNVDLSIANAFRRVMIAEVPTMAIDLVEFEMNTV